MCLAIPGKVTSIDNPSGVDRTGRVDFGGIKKNVNLMCVPEANVGDYVIVHVGVAISKVNETEAKRVFSYLKEMDELKELT